MKKIINFAGIDKYYCIKCQCYHLKIKGNKYCKPFKDHKKFAYLITKQELFKFRDKKDLIKEITENKNIELYKPIYEYWINEPINMDE